MKKKGNECDYKRPTTYDLLKQMRAQGDLGMYIGFAKEAIFHILFECAITVYSIELLAILTKFFIKDIAEIPNPILFIFLPSILVIPVTFLFILLFVRIFLVWMQPYSKSAVEKKIDDLLSKKGALIKRLKIIHFVGVVFYAFLTTIIPVILCRNYTDSIININIFIISMAIIGIILGAIWNITGYYRDIRFFLAKYIERTGQNSAKAKTVLFHLTWNNIKGNIASVIILFINSVVIIIFANESLLQPTALQQLTTEYSFVIVLYIMLIAVYLRNGYKLLYPQTHEEADLFPSITFMLDMKK